MEDPKVLFADTTARRAQLMAATERLKSSITDGVDSIKEDIMGAGPTGLLIGISSNIVKLRKIARKSILF